MKVLANLMVMTGLEFRASAHLIKMEIIHVDIDVIYQHPILEKTAIQMTNAMAFACVQTIRTPRDT